LVPGGTSEMTFMNKYLLAGSFLAVLPLVAQAQVEEITVSAQRRDANLQEVPISVSAFSNDDIQRLQINFAQDLATNVPNMKMYDVTANDAAMQVFMRGAGIQNPGFNASESPVGLYVDEVYRGRLATANLEVADIERVEVLRGPQGTLYGRNTIAGAVKYITRDPGDDMWADVTAGYGNFETSKITASVGGPLMEGKLGGSLAGMYNKRGEGWITRGSTGGRDLGEFKNTAFRGKLNWYGGEVFSSEFSLSYIDNENDGYNGIPYGSANDDPPTKPDYNPAASPGAPVEGFYDTLVPDSAVGTGSSEQINSMLRLTWDFGGMALNSITGYSDIDDAFAFDLNGGVSQCNNVPGFCPDVQLPKEIGVKGIFINSTSSNKTITQEFTLAGTTANDSLEWIAGLFYMNEEGDQQYAPTWDAAFSSIIEDVDTKTNSYAVFGEGTYSFTDKLALTLGARWTRDEKEWSATCTNLTGGPFPGCYPTNAPPGNWTNDLDKDFSKFTPRALLQYEITDGTMLWGSVSSGFQAGGFQTLCFGSQPCYDNIYDPQDVVSAELGVKTDLANNTVRINASTFYAAYDDMQQTAIVAGSFPVINVGGADVFGVELEAYWSPLDSLDFYLIFGYAKDELDSESKAELSDSTELPGLPKTAGKLGVDWRLPVFNSWNFLVGADVEYSDDYYATIANNLLIDSYARFNGRIGFDQPDGNWSLILAGTNLTDEEDLYSGIAGGGTNLRTPQRPREYMLTLGFKY
jgi:iron complex outermembrane receptor protein